MSILVVGLGLALGGLACGDDESAGAGSNGGDGGGGGPPVRACTEIGCASGLYLDVRAVRRELPEAERLRVCLAAKCRGFDLDRTDLVAMGLRGLGERQRVAVRMVVLDAAGEPLARRRTTAPVRRSRPNGPGCPPVCFQVAVRLERDGLRLTPRG
jgi:hypothetical protein